MTLDSTLLDDLANDDPFIAKLRDLAANGAEPLRSDAQRELDSIVRDFYSEDDDDDDFSDSPIDLSELGELAGRLKRLSEAYAASADAHPPVQ